jgi:hypothetical protein
MEASQHLADRLQIGLNILGLAGIAMQRSQNIHAARLLGAAEHLLEAYHSRLDPANHADYDRIRDALYAGIDNASLSTAQAAGYALPLEQAIAEAQSVIKELQR